LPVGDGLEVVRVLVVEEALVVVDVGADVVLVVVLVAFEVVEGLEPDIENADCKMGI
jgi:hypothetical protein